MLLDPVAVTVDALVAAGFNAHPTAAETAGSVTPGIPKEAISSLSYFWVEEDSFGTTPHIRYSDRPSIRVINYSNQGVSKTTELARQAQTALLEAQGVKYTSGGIHRVITVQRPHREDLEGLPPGVGRASALYDLILSSQSHWS